MNDTLFSSIFSVLSADSELNELVADRIFPVKVAQSTEFPNISFSRVSRSAGLTMSGPSNEKSARVQFDVYTKNYTDINDIANQLVKLLHGKTGGFGSSTLWVSQLVYSEDGYTHQNDTFTTSLDFQFFYEDNVN